MKVKSQGRLREFALVGARARLQELRNEEAQLRSEFPELFRGSKAAVSAAGGTRRRRKPMSAAQRKAVAERMRKYWADRKKKSA